MVPALHRVLHICLWICLGLFFSCQSQHLPPQKGVGSAYQNVWASIAAKLAEKGAEAVPEAREMLQTHADLTEEEIVAGWVELMGWIEEEDSLSAHMKMGFARWDSAQHPRPWSYLTLMDFQYSEHNQLRAINTPEEIAYFDELLESHFSPADSVYFSTRAFVDILWAKLYVGRRQMDQAMAKVLKAEKINQAYGPLHFDYLIPYVQGYAEYGLGKSVKAYESFELCQQKAEGHPHCHAARNYAARGLHWLANLHQEWGESEVWAEWSREAMYTFRKLGDIDEIPPLADLMMYYARKGEWSRSDMYRSRLDSLNEFNANPYLQSIVAHVNGEAICERGDREKGLALMLSSLSLDPEKRAHQYYIKNVIRVYEEMGDYKETARWKDSLFKEYKDAVSQDKLITIEALKLGNELQLKEAETQSLLSEKEVQDARILAQSQLILGGTIAFIVILILVMYLWQIRGVLMRQKGELVRAQQEAEAASLAKAEFLSVMSHEIRTPLNGIVGPIHLLMDEDPRADQKESLETLRFSAQHLLGLVNDILDYSKIEAGKLQLEEIELNLESLCRGVISTLAWQAEEKGLNLLLSFPQSLPSRYNGDPVRLAQILTNLVSNAIKFTAKGQVCLKVKEGNGLVHFAVEDTGIGVPLDKQATIFEKFSQAEAHTSREYGGTGLGLSISARLVELMGGELQLESRPGKGSIFYFQLPLYPVTSVGAHNTILQTREGLVGARILVAEDNPLNQKIARRFLEKWGAEIAMASNGQEAVDVIQNFQPDLILMDIRMPIMDGIEATRHIRNQQNSVPIIALTASALPDEVKEMKEAGVNEWVSKPFNPDDLKARLCAYLPETTTA